MSAHDFLMSAWDWKPSVVLGCGLVMAGYAWSTRFRFSARAAAFAAGVLAILLTLVSPMDELADHYLFSVHMAKHILFVLIAPALLLMGLPAAPMEQAMRIRNVARAERFLRQPAVAWTAGVGAMIAWHIPALFNKALANEPLHIAEHLSLLACGTIFWWPILSPLPQSRMRPLPHAAAYLFTACLACTSLGIAITFARSLLYPAYAHPADVYAILPLIRENWGISPQMDQQIGGLLMWAPACLVYVTAIMAMFARWYAEEAERKEARLEAFE
ncbi:MAG TPA: cytochrome c oxidase assembly protein [Bryobacteraceae bacterium]|nr:cytochrome c oxidase assembly protein [Bryobacteraceae bacterium]